LPRIWIPATTATLLIGLIAGMGIQDCKDSVSQSVPPVSSKGERQGLESDGVKAPGAI
jgi:hypothetical protein